ncbi:IS66 family insertion sequence element accessory protein TnpB [Bradyrhizobium sp. Rc2d]|uniref:IS66 family insertion sequence element accessory protein TnpB n=1 Tax=Bradyrhizobium sp. Rc2d TaxID=1855321 RepID=UPI00115FA6A6|nr:IS66 family insertion sequence element accessory protein TnpB [Bradyrhizobium sp. Rc2d]
MIEIAIGEVVVRAGVDVDEAHVQRVIRTVGPFGMIPSGVKVFLASHPVDFRKGIDGLVALVRDAGSDLFDGALYVFRGKRADRIKIVWWDDSGVCLYLKHLEKAKFCWPRIGSSSGAANLRAVDGTGGWDGLEAGSVKPIARQSGWEVRDNSGVVTIAANPVARKGFING